MMYLARANRQAGNIVAVTGEGADEALAGYVWFKTPLPSKLQERLNRPLEHLVRSAVLSGLIGGGAAHRPKFRGMSGYRVGQQLAWEIAGQSREYLYSNEMWRQLSDWSAYDEVKLPTERLKRWHPLNRAIYLGYKTLLPGLLMAGKGDRPIRAASTEGRYPFLDEQVVDFCSTIAPHFKLRRLTDKWLLRQVAAKVTPNQVRSRRKHMFRATMSHAFLRNDRSAWVDELLSPQSLSATGYFDPVKVSRAREIQRRKSKYSLQRFSVDVGLIGVIATQLWHHIFCGGGLADLDTWTPTHSIGRTNVVPQAHFRQRAYATPVNGDSGVRGPRDG